LSAVCSNRLELEDVELKHNSAIKQLMREYNTQMALRDRELDTAVKETIGEAGEKSFCINEMKPTTFTAVL